MYYDSCRKYLNSTGTPEDSSKVNAGEAIVFVRGNYYTSSMKTKGEFAPPTASTD